MKSYLLFILILTFAFPAFAQSPTAFPDKMLDGIKYSAYPAEKVKNSLLSWEGHFGGRATEPANLYTLMTQGGFRAPTSDNFKELVKLWNAQHPQAETTLIYTMEGSTAVANSKIKAVWIADEKDNLNIYLVRKGGCPAGTMVLNTGDETPLTREQYKTFLKSLLEAGYAARQEKLGIWKDEK